MTVKSPRDLKPAVRGSISLYCYVYVSKGSTSLFTFNTNELHSEEVYNFISSKVSEEGSTTDELFIVVRTDKFSKKNKKKHMIMLANMQPIYENLVGISLRDIVLLSTDNENFISIAEIMSY